MSERKQNDTDDICDHKINNDNAEQRSASTGVYDDDDDDEYSIDDDGQDDEATLDEEEKLENSNEIATELEALHQEQDIPIEDLMRLYGCEGHSFDSANRPSAHDITEDEPSFDASGSSYENASPRRSIQATSNVELDLQGDFEAEEGQTLDIRCLTGESSLEDDDEDYEPNDDWRKDVRIGDAYQVYVDDKLPSEPLSRNYPSTSHETVVFDPSKISEDEIRTYLRQFYTIFGEGSVIVSSPRCDLSDNEIALDFLHEHIYDTEAALSDLTSFDYEAEKIKKNPTLGWTEEDRTAFESCLRSHGKDFTFVHNTFSGKTMKEMIHFYYHWKISPNYSPFVTSLEMEYVNYVNAMYQIRENEIAGYRQQHKAPDGTCQMNVPLSLLKPLPRPPFPFRVSTDNGRVKLRWAAPMQQQRMHDSSQNYDHGHTLLRQNDALNYSSNQDLTYFDVETCALNPSTSATQILMIINADQATTSQSLSNDNNFSQDEKS